MNLLAIFPDDYTQRRQGKLAASTASGAEYKIKKVAISSTYPTPASFRLSGLLC
jgi:hypothetical protein